MATAAQIATFINQIAPIIQKEAKARGYKVCSPVIAQACVESAFGLSSLAYKYHNYFGMKCGKSWKGKSVNLKTKEEYTKGTLTTIKDNFRVYDNMEAGVKGYFDFINTKRYANLKSATTPREYLELIKKDGYATSSTYVNTNMNYINKYGLDKYDEGHVDNSYKLTEKVLKKGMKGESVKWLQTKLNQHGYNLVVDGDFGSKTATAVIDFQQKHGLFVDAIVGSQTINALNGV